MMVEFADKVFACNWSVAQLDNVIKTYLDSQKPKLKEILPPPVETKPIETEPSKDIPCNGCLKNVTCDRSKFTVDGHGGYQCEERSSTPPAEKDEAGEEQEDQQMDENTKGNQKSSIPKLSVKTKPAVKSAVKKPGPVRTAAPPAPVKPTWKRKLVLEETGNIVRVNIMAEGKFPVMKGFTGSLEAVLQELPAFLAETNARWEVK
jgi:hypothetical protein